MTIIDWLAAGLVVPFVVNWLAFVVLAVANHRNPGIRTLSDRRWVALGIAASSTAFALLAGSYFTHISLDALAFALLLTVPLYALTAVNGVFLYLTWRGRW